MADQFDLFAAPAPVSTSAPSRAVEKVDTLPHPMPAPPYPWPNAHLRPPRRICTLAAPSPDSLAALAAVELLGELPPIVPGALPRVAVARAGWDRAMAHRRHLVAQRIARTIAPGDDEALSALSYTELQQVDFAPTGPVILTADGYEHLANALAGLRCAAMEAADG